MQQELAKLASPSTSNQESSMRLPNPVKAARHIGLMGEDLAAFLNTLQALNKQQFQSVQKLLHNMIPSVTGH